MKGSKQVVAMVACEFSPFLSGPPKATSCKSQADALTLLLSSKHFLVEKFQIVKHTWHWIGNSRRQLLAGRESGEIPTFDRCGWWTLVKLSASSMWVLRFAHPICNGYTCVWHFFSWKSSSSIPSWSYMDHHQQQHKEEREEEEEPRNKKKGASWWTMLRVSSSLDVTSWITAPCQSTERYHSFAAFCHIVVVPL